MRSKTLVQIFSRTNMKTYQREILLSLLALAATALALWYFFGSMTKEKTIAHTDLYSMLDPAPTALLIINRPAVFTRMMLSQEKIKQAFATYIPDIYLSIIEDNPTLPLVIFSFHEQGIVMYAKTDEGQAYLIRKKNLQPIYNTYPAPRQKKNGITFTYYPDIENRFLGCYYSNGAWVASYSKRLLEEAAGRQINTLSSSDFLPTAGLHDYMKSLDGHAPLHVMLPANRMNLYVQVNDTTEWRIRNKWLTADIFTDNGALCCIGGEPYHAVLDTLYSAMADTLSLRLQHAFPSFHIHTQTDIGQEIVYFTSCLF